jgi:8-oxo-dGTP pyrophosphatase MutT (NUDIX family)
MPQGGIKLRQTIEEAAIEEAYEELGVPRELFRLRGVLLYAHSYEWDRVPQHYQGLFRGQHQRFAVIDFLGTDNDIRVDWCVVKSAGEEGMVDSGVGAVAGDEEEFCQEFSRWKWCTIQEIMNTCAPMRRRGYRGAFMEYVDKFGE